MDLEIPIPNQSGVLSEYISEGIPMSNKTPINSDTSTIYACLTSSADEEAMLSSTNPSCNRQSDPQIQSLFANLGEKYIDLPLKTPLHSGRHAKHNYTLLRSTYPHMSDHVILRSLQIEDHDIINSLPLKKENGDFVSGHFQDDKMAQDHFHKQVEVLDCQRKQKNRAKKKGNISEQAFPENQEDLPGPTEIDLALPSFPSASTHVFLNILLAVTLVSIGAVLIVIRNFFITNLAYPPIIFHLTYIFIVGVGILLGLGIGWQNIHWRKPPDAKGDLNPSDNKGFVRVYHGLTLLGIGGIVATFIFPQFLETLLPSTTLLPTEIRICASFVIVVVFAISLLMQVAYQIAHPNYHPRYATVTNRLIGIYQKYPKICILFLLDLGVPGLLLLPWSQAFLVNLTSPLQIISLTCIVGSYIMATTVGVAKYDFLK